MMIDFYPTITCIVLFPNKMCIQQQNNTASDQSAKRKNREKRYHHELNILLRETFIKQGTVPCFINYIHFSHISHTPYLSDSKINTECTALF